MFLIQIINPIFGGKRFRFRMENMEKRENMYVAISSQAQETLFDDIYQRKHIEACGVLVGSIDEQGNWHVEQALPLRNIFDSPVYFEFAPEELLMAELNYPDKIVGVYHSHPTGLATASSTDRQNMRRVNRDQLIPWVWLIISGPFDEAFAQRHQGRINDTSMVAYHHYTEEGLRRVIIQIEETARNTPHPMP